MEYQLIGFCVNGEGGTVIFGQLVYNNIFSFSSVIKKEHDSSAQGLQMERVKTFSPLGIPWLNQEGMRLTRAPFG